jgi:Mg-chelatase subunit ChlD
LTFERLWPFALLAVIPFLWRIRLATVVDLSPKHLQLSTLIRSALVACIALALAQPILVRTARYLSVVYLLDVSQSVSPASVQEALQWIQKTHDAGNPEHARFIAFASNSMAFDRPEDLSRVRVSPTERPGTVDQSRTRLAAALDHAIRSFAAEHLKRLVLISDGNANSGNLETALEHLRQEQVRVYTRPMASRTTRDAWIESVISPSTVTAEEPFPVEVHVYSQYTTTANLELKARGQVLARRTVVLNEGMNRIAFEASVKDESPTAVLEAAADVVGDSLVANNAFRQSASVLGKPRILYVEGYAPSARYLKDALTIEGFKVDVAAPPDLPEAAKDFDSWDAVIVSDVDRRLISEAQMKAITSYVRDYGGGFILAGGENTYGKEGYSESAIEEVLPVTFDTEKQREPLAMVVVLDRSGSMAGQKMELAKEATKAPLADLIEQDQFGVIVFDYNFKWEIEIQKITPESKEQMRETISRIVATGNTNIFPALREAYEKLREIPGETKHIILLSDGQTPADDFRGLASEMVKEKITVSTVAVTAASDRVLMENIANWGGGRAYYVDNPAGVVQIFADETNLAAGKSVRDESFLPVVKKTVEAFKGIDFKTAPQLHGYVATKAKSTAEVLLATRLDRPLLARWQYGLGKTAIFTSDVKDRWAAEWLGWKGYSKFWAQFVRETLRRQDNDEFDLQVTREGDEAVVSINAMEENGRFRNALQPQVRIENPLQQSLTMDVPQVGPGAYEIRVPLPEDGSYVFRTSGQGVGNASRTLEFSYPDEYHFYPPDTRRLRALSSETGGIYQPAGPEIFNTGGETVSHHTQLWPWLTFLALVLYLADVLLRRLRLFET